MRKKHLDFIGMMTLCNTPRSRENIVETGIDLDCLTCNLRAIYRTTDVPSSPAERQGFCS